MNKSVQFINSLDLLKQKKIPAEVLDRAKQSLLDYLAVTAAGTQFQKEKLDKYFKYFEPEEGKFKVIGSNKNLVLKEAVFLNGLNSHALDFDDGTNSGIIHLGAPIFSLLLPLAQKNNISLSKLLKSAVMGYEASYTMAISIQPLHKSLGFHATGTCGTLGAVIAASYMLDYSKEERFQAFASACVSASGMLKVLDDGSELKPYNVAKTSLLALTSLQLAKAGFAGHYDPLGGRGFLKMMTGRDDIKIKEVFQDNSYAIMKTYTKPYASCRYTHPAVEGAILISKNNSLDLEDIDKIVIRTYDLAVKGHDHVNINSIYSAKMSIPFATSVALLYGKAGINEFSEESLNSLFVKSLTKKIKVIPDKALSENFPDKQTAIIEIFSGDKIYKEKIDFPKGEPENPLSESEFKDRYFELMEYARIDNETYKNIYYDIRDNNPLIEEIVSKL